MRRDWMAGLALALATAGAAHAASFDARRAADVSAFVTAHGASGALKKSDGGEVYFDGHAGAIAFDVHFQACDDKRTQCNTMLMGASWDSKKLTVDQINGWNRWTLFCPAYLDKDNAPNIWYAIAVTGNTGQDDLATPFSYWTNCLHDFDSFVGGPEAFLKSHA